MIITGTPSPQRMKPMPLRPSLALLFAALLALAGCRELPKLNLDGVEPGSPLVSLETPEVTVLGGADGPWKLERVVSPTVVELSREGATREFAIIGLHPDESPDPGAPAGTARLDPDELQRLGEIRAFKVEQLGKLLEGAPVWVLHVSEGTPPGVHLLTPAKPGALTLGSKATLVSAAALRRGVASMDLDAPADHLRDTMLDCEFAAIAEALNLAADADRAANLWTRFDLRLPPARWDERIDAMEKKLGLGTK